MLEGVPFGEAVRQALSDAEEIFSEQPLTAPSPPTNVARDPLLSVEDFAVEQADPSPSGEVSSPRRTTSAGTSSQPPPGSGRSAPIIFDDGKIQLFHKSPRFLVSILNRD